MIVYEGSNVRFQCSFEGSVRIPDWKINETIYYWEYIPDPFMFDTSDFSLNIQNVQRSLSGTTFQCVLPGLANSSLGYLIVLHTETHVGTTHIELQSTYSIKYHSHGYTG